MERNNLTSIYSDSIKLLDGGATAFTEDLELDGGWISGDTLGSKLTASPQSKDFGVAKTNFISQNLDSTDSEIYVIVVTNLSSTDTTTCGASFQWREIY